VVHFAGWVDKDLPEHLAGIDILVNPSLRSWSETFCIVNIEAMSMQIPLVTFGVGGVAEYVSPPSTAIEERNALLVDEPTPEVKAQPITF
jgi:glycosyltransferase involved in cell wall biosynthesis